MRYIDKYKGCIAYSASKYCDTTVSCAKLCNSYDLNHKKEDHDNK